MKRVIIILALAIVVFGITFEVAILYIQEHQEMYADNIISENVGDLIYNITDELKQAESDAYSMLAGNFFFKFGEEDSLKRDTTAYLKDTAIGSLNPDDLYNTISDFLKINTNIRGVMFVFQPKAFPHYHANEGRFIPIMIHGDTTRYDFADRYQHINTSNFANIMMRYESQWSKPFRSIIDSTYVTSFYIPLRFKNNNILGVMAVDLSTKHLEHIIKTDLPINHIRTYVIDKDLNIIVSNDSAANTGTILSESTVHLNKSVIDTIKAHAVTEPYEKIRRIRSNAKQHDDIVFHTRLKHVPWTIVAILPRDVAYSEVATSRYQLGIVSGIGVLLMLLCCTAVYRHILRETKKRTAIEAELSTAAKVQMGMLPNVDNAESAIRDHLYATLRPSKQVGGDLYDFAVRDNLIYFIIGDVAGKGVPASLFMTQVCSLFRDGIIHTEDPSRIVANISHVLAQNNSQNMFCTMIVGIFNYTTGELAYCNAGHNAPVLKRSDGITEFISVNPNLPVALEDDFPYQKHMLQLHKGDILILYTDGISEAEDKNHKCYGDNALLHFVRDYPSECTAKDITKSLLNTILNYEKGTEQSDDITILSIEM